MTEEAGKAYETGIAYLGAARRILAAARRLDDEDREQVRHVADGLVSKATDLLTSVVRPRRARRQPGSESGEGSKSE